MFTAFPIIAQALLDHEWRPGGARRRARHVQRRPARRARRRCRTACPRTVQVTGFGMTETGGSVVLSRPDEPRDVRLGAEGAPYPGMELEIRDVDTGEPCCAVGERGEIVVRGPQVFSGYFKSPEKNAEVLEPAAGSTPATSGLLDEYGRLHLPGPGQGHAQGRRRERRRDRDRELPRHPPGGVDRPGGRRARRPLRRGAGGVRRVEAGRHGRPRTRSSRSARARWRASRCRGTSAWSTEWPMSATKVQKFRLRDQLVAEWASAAANG